MYHMKDVFLLKKMQKTFFMHLHQMDIDGFKSDFFLLPYGPLEPMVINFTCDLSLVWIPPRDAPLTLAIIDDKNAEDKFSYLLIEKYVFETF